MADLVLKNRNGEPQDFTGAIGVKILNANGELQKFSPGVAVENVPIALDFSNGNQIVNAPDGTLVRSAILLKPENLTPGNIVKDVEIAGIVGTHEGGGGVDFSDPNFQFFTYQIDDANKQIILYSILYAVLYEITGSYDVNIPNKIGGFDVVIACM